MASPPVTPAATPTATFTQRYSLGPVKPITEAAAYIIGPMFGIKTIYGWRQSDPFPDHPSGHALDFMIPNTETGNRLAAFAQANAGPLGVKYIIWNRQYWQPGSNWVPYTATSNPHTDHVHITFNDTTTGGTVTNNGGTGTSATGVADPNAAAPDTCAWNLAAPQINVNNPVPFLPDVKIGGQSFCLLSKQQVRVMLGISVLATGIMVGLVGTVLLVVYGLAKSGTGSAVLSAVPGGSIAKKFI